MLFNKCGHSNMMVQSFTRDVLHRESGTRSGVDPLTCLTDERSRRVLRLDEEASSIQWRGLG